MDSIWRETAALPGFERLESDVNTDILIIGGGLSGLLCAYMLERRGADYMLVEADRICGGTTGYTTAKITSQHGLIYAKLAREFGDDAARLYYGANEQALHKYRELCADIDCDFEPQDSYVYSLSNRAKLERELAVLRRLKIPAEFTEQPPLPFETVGAIKFAEQAQFNPLKFVSAIAKGLNIYEHTAVRELVGTDAITDRARICARRIVVATHFPFINKHGFYFLKLHQQRSYVIALENAGESGGMLVDEEENGLSFRNYDNLLLLGGGGHRTGKKGGCWQELRAFAKRYYPDSVERAHWAAQDCMTLDGIPYIGSYSNGSDNLYVATGFNKWGISSSMAAALLLADMLLGKKNVYKSLFNPSRTILRPSLAVNVMCSATGLLTPSARRCPHLGCALKWNSAEHSWDCPCHGSRFAEDGELLNNPATGDLDTKR